MEEIKLLSVVDKKIDDLFSVADVLYKFKGLIEPADYFTVNDKSITLWPNDEAQSRRYVGALTRIFKSVPKVEKSSNSLTAHFVYNGVLVKVYGYKTKKCVVVKKQVFHAAVEEQVIPAKEAYVEEVEELVCEMPTVQHEIAPPQAVPAAASAEVEVPF